MSILLAPKSVLGLAWSPSMEGPAGGRELRLEATGSGSVEGGHDCEAGVGVGCRQAQGLEELLPSQQEVPAAGSLGPRRHGPSGGDGTPGAEPAQSSEASSELGPLHPGTLVLTSFCLDPGVMPKVTCVGRNTSPLPVYSSLQANLSTHSTRVCQGHLLQLWASVHLCSNCLRSPHRSCGLSPSHLFCRSVLPHPSLQEAPLVI